VETLRRHRLAVADEYGIARVGGSSYVFASSNGTAWRPHKVTDGFRALARKSGIVAAPTCKRATTRKGRRAIPQPSTERRRKPAEITFHSLRHTCASLLLAQGVHPKVVQEMLGHSTVSITMDLYSHTTPTLQSEAAVRLEAVLRLPAGAATA
jgi:site-specific recombinase XerC